VGSPEVLLQVSPAGAQEDELDALTHHPGVVVPDEVHPLLVVQPPYEAQHGDVGPHRQPQLLHPNTSLLSNHIQLMTLIKYNNNFP